MDVELNVAEATHSSEQGSSYDDLVTESLTEVATEGKGQAKSTPSKRELTPEEILRGVSKKTTMNNQLEVKDEDGQDESFEDEVIEQDESLETEGESDDSEEELLDIIYKGQVEPLPKSEVIKLAQMGKDYTVKTQALAAERQKFQAESLQKTQELDQLRSQFEESQRGFSENKESFDKMQFAFGIIKDSNPDLYAELDQAVAQVLNQYDNPIIRRQNEMLSQKQKMIEDQLASLTGEGIKQKYFAEEKQVRADFEESLKSLGVIPDWNKVKEAYANGAQDVKTALFAVYGAEITQAANSKQKLDMVRKQTARTVTKPSIKTPARTQGKPQDYSRKTYSNIMGDVLKELGL